MTIVVLVSTMSMTVNTHYCGNILVDKAVMKPAQKCAMHSAPSQHDNEDENNNCCENQVEVIKGQDQLKLQSSDFQLPLPIFVEAFIFTFFVNSFIEAFTNTAIHGEPPPLFLSDFQAFYQVFLI